MMKVLPSMACWDVLFLAFFTAFAHGAVPPEGNPEMADLTSDSLAGTTWSGPDSGGNQYVYTFERDGTLSYKSPTGSYKNGTWKQFGNAIYFETNNRYSEYRGEISGKMMKGRAWNTTGKAWTWKAAQD